ncbi:CPBP family intramembrane metalloprotease [Streptococcus equi subsp. zooepidemicus]|uniref:CPBP family intramembrane glutamic endopeptidase n=1 Tax=Streptococcus equi TaxID=1336 RepID=UPI0010CABACB|nr:type II CAAX endopeptidase family protein [Streptococcus equi]MCD3411721.1 CPBP family intramembrane metalloprotease [Streptococcus equi subsp. zooepidemicus]MCD3411732.1 CPBP family intramembrane metalloprotease [Streptococcus equi subsp. zooepidemicus]MCD3412298.1 CPBP family intramembrane metalloprotease [Streptococcus equi subsp. zooepidemicus]MCD3452468.1 CPBP family intramembrane metalloprotease [Streptococcus equi subsp. zooepidemicus]MDI6076704.1 type II CAAX endopeptidase family pr
MPLYTQCLNLCFLMATFCPSIAMQAIFGQGRDSYSFNLIGFLRAVLVYYALVLTGIYLLSPPIKAPLGHSDSRLLIIGFILSFVVLFVEVAFLHISRCWQKKEWLPLVLSFVGTTQKWPQIGYPLVLACCEEITYRLIWFNILWLQWRLPIALVLLITSLCYALNHFLMGRSIFYAKILTGLIYGSIYYVSQSFWLVLLVHVGGNLWVEGLSHLQSMHKKVVR